jgi:outer membrane protein assembly factor BamA
MKNKLIQFSVILLLFFTAQVYANPINKINFIGLNNTSESTLLKSLSFKVGQNFSPDASDEIIEELFKTGFFSDIKIIKNEKTLDITLIENPYIRFKFWNWFIRLVKG